MRGMRPLRHAAVDMAAIGLLGLLVTLTFGPVFGGTGYLLAGVGGTVLGIAVGFFTSRPPLRNGLVTLAGAMLVFVVFGCALAVPHGAIWGVIPTLEGLRELLLGAVFAWKNLLTAEPPAAGFPSLLVVPYATGLASATLATVLALRLRDFALLAMAPPAIGLGIAIMMGTSAEPYSLVTGALFAAVALTWLTWRRQQTRSGRLSRAARLNTEGGRSRQRARAAQGVGMVLVATLAGTAVGAAGVPASRTVLRDQVQPPVQLADYPSPLSGFRQWHKTYADEALLLLSGMPSGSRLRVAVLDTYTGEVMGFAPESRSSGSGSFARVGTEIDTRQTGEAATVEVEVAAYTGIWLPTVGYATQIDFAGQRAEQLQTALHYNGSTGGAVTMAGLEPGDAYTLRAVVPQAPAVDRLAGVSVADLTLPEPAELPAHLQSWAQMHGTGATSRLENILALQQQLQSGGFSHGLDSDVLPSLAGHSVFRIDSMFADDTPIGDDEQYSVALALALRSLGIPARVVMGFYPEQGFDGSPVELTGADVHAWVEVPFEGYGWVPFDASPPEDNTEINLDPPPAPAPQPRVLQPPQPPDPPDEFVPDAAFDDAESEEDEPESQPSWFWLGASAIVVGSLLLIFAPFLLVRGLRQRRRRRRMRAEHPKDRLGGSWHEFVDTAIDFGAAVPAGATRSEQARVLEHAYPGLHATALSDHIDRGVFAREDPEPEAVTHSWRLAAEGAAGIRAATPRRGRLRAALSLRSFRARRPRRSRA